MTDQTDDASTPQSPAVDHARLVRGFSIQLVGRLVSLTLSLISIAITIRYLGVDRYGILTAVVAFSGVFDAFSDIGLSSVTIRRATAGKDPIERLVGLNLGISMTYAVPLWAVTSAAGFLVYSGRPQYQLGVAIVASSLLFRAISTCYDALFEVASRFTPLAVSDMSSRVLTIVLMVIAVRLDIGLVAFFVIQTLPTVVRLSVLTWSARTMGHVRPLFERPAMVALVKEGIPLAAISLVAALYYRADGVLLSLLSSERQVGAYGLGYRMAANLSVIQIVFLATVFPTLARLFSADRGAYNAFAARTTEVMALLAVPVAIFGAFISPEAVAIFASHKAVPVAAMPSRLLFIAIAVGFVNALLAQSLIAAHDQRFLVRLGIVSLLVNIGLNLGLDGRFGAIGAASALVSTESLSLVVAFTRLHHVSGYRIPVPYLLRLGTAAAVTVAVWAVTRPVGFALAFPLALVVFAIALMIAGPLRPAEIRGLVELLRPGSRRPEPEPFDVADSVEERPPAESADDYA